jgi:hypothetical protein
MEDWTNGKTCIEHLIQFKESYKTIIQKELASMEESIARLKRLKWWLEHPEVAYFTARTEWETERYTLKSYLSMLTQ